MELLRDVLNKRDYREVVGDVASLDYTPRDYFYESDSEKGLFISSMYGSSYKVFLDKDEAESWVEDNESRLWDGEVLEYVYGDDEKPYYIVVLEPSQRARLFATN